MLDAKLNNYCYFCNKDQIGNMKTELVICMGSSCFARGNKKILAIIQEFIQSHNLSDKVIFKGNHCFGKCNNGPNIKINDTLHEGVNEETIIELLEKEFNLI